jgi:hypothetical protein
MPLDAGACEFTPAARAPACRQAATPRKFKHYCQICALATLPLARQM